MTHEENSMMEITSQAGRFEAEEHSIQMTLSLETDDIHVRKRLRGNLCRFPPHQVPILSYLCRGRRTHPCTHHHGLLHGQLSHHSCKEHILAYLVAKYSQIKQVMKKIQLYPLGVGTPQICVAVWIFSPWYLSPQTQLPQVFFAVNQPKGLMK